MTVPGSLWSFEGRWQLERQIEDARLGHAKLEGEAVLRRSGHRLVYDETGQLHLPDRPPMTATRRYFWEARGNWVAIRFEDGRPFHGFPLRTEQPEATHLCDPDRYEVAYDFSAWPRWTARWRVTGPRKDYRMISQFRR